MTASVWLVILLESAGTSCLRSDNLYVLQLIVVYRLTLDQTSSIGFNLQCATGERIRPFPDSFFICRIDKDFNLKHACRLFNFCEEIPFEIFVVEWNAPSQNVENSFRRCLLGVENKINNTDPTLIPACQHAI